MTCLYLYLMSFIQGSHGYRDKCYTLVVDDGQKTWSGAQQACEDSYLRLAVVDDMYVYIEYIAYITATTTTTTTATTTTITTKTNIIS